MLNARRKGDALMVRVDFELDQHHADMVRGELEEMLADPGVKRLVLDLSGMNFMDSSGIGFILGRARTLKPRGGVVAVAGMSPHVDRIMRMSGLYRVVERNVAARTEGA